MMGNGSLVSCDHSILLLVRLVSGTPSMTSVTGPGPRHSPGNPCAGDCREFTKSRRALSLQRQPICQCLLPPQCFTKLKSSCLHLNPPATFPAPDKCTGRSKA